MFQFIIYYGIISHLVSQKVIRPSEFKRKLLEYSWNNCVKDEYDNCIDNMIIFDEPTNSLSHNENGN